MVGTFPAGAGAFTAAFDGANIWITNPNDNALTMLRARDGSDRGTFALAESPFDIIYDGTCIWVANIGDNTVSKITRAQ